MSRLLVRAEPRNQRGSLCVDDTEYPCALGRSGLTETKREGDGATPIGAFFLRRLMFRPDRVTPPRSDLPILTLHETMGWCDDPARPVQYNRLVSLPFDGRHERLWRDDALYDLIVELGYNDDPPRPGLGSAIFLHVAGVTADGLAPTEGCVALRRDDLIAVVAGCSRESTIEIGYPEGTEGTRAA